MWMEDPKQQLCGDTALTRLVAPWDSGKYEYHLTKWQFI